MGAEKTGKSESTHWVLPPFEPFSAMQRQCSTPSVAVLSQLLCNGAYKLFADEVEPAAVQLRNPFADEEGRSKSMAICMEDVLRATVSFLTARVLLPANGPEWDTTCVMTSCHVQRCSQEGTGSSDFAHNSA